MRNMFDMKDKMVQEMPGYTIFIDFGIAYHVHTGRTEREYIVSAVKGSVIYQHRSISLFQAYAKVIEEYKAYVDNQSGSTIKVWYGPEEGFIPSDIPQSEANALMAFYNATDGPNWTNNTGWGTDPVVGNWYGVRVANGHVTGLDLNGNHNTLSGPGLQYLSGLTGLTQLSLYSTGVTGDIATLSGLIDLSNLYLYGKRSHV